MLELQKKYIIQNYNNVNKSIIETDFMSFYTRKSYKFMAFFYVMIILKL